MIKLNLQYYTDALFRDLTSLGGVIIYGIFAILLLIITENLKVFEQLITALIIAYAITILIRSVYYKPRPNEEEHTTFLKKLEASSFPSLHSMRAIIQLIIYGALFNNILITATLSILALLVIISRLELGKHDITDVSIGAIIGAIITAIVMIYI